MRVWTILGVFLGVLIIAFGIFVLRITESEVPDEAPAAPSAAPITDIHFLDSYRKGTHSINGSATVPTACTTLNASSTVYAATASSSDVLRVDLSAPADTGICLELPTKQTFSVSDDASADAVIEIYANGVLATTTS